MAKHRNNILAMLLAVLMVVAMMPLLTLKTYAFTEVDFSGSVNGLYGGNIIIGTTIGIDVDKVISSNPVMKAAFEKSGTVEEVRLWGGARFNLYFKGDGNGYYKLYMPNEQKYVGAQAYIIISISDDDDFLCPLIDVIDKYDNTFAVTGNTAKVKRSAVRKKAQYLAVSKLIKFKNKGQGTKTYTFYSAKKGGKSYKKYFSVNKTTGKLTIKKGLKKGTYYVKIRVKAKGDASHKASALKTATVKIIVK